MTDDMEERLREVLRRRSDVPTVAGDPVASVRDRMRRRSRRRGVAVASTAALCVAVAAIAATALAGNGPATRPIGPAVSSSPTVNSLPPTSTPRPSAPSSGAASVPLVSAQPSAPATATSVATSSSPPTATLPSNVSVLTLPTTDTYYGLSTDAGSLGLTGAVASSDPNAPCLWTPVDPAALTLGPVTPGSCGGPPPPGDLASIVEGNPDAGSNDFATTVAVTHVSPTTGAMTTGPIVMRLNEASNTHVIIALGGGSMWIYDVATTNGPEAIQVSETTGQVLGVIRTPQLFRPIMVANGDGLWLGNSIEGSQVSGTLFHVAPGSHIVTTVVANANDAVDWMVAGSGRVWAGIRPWGSSLLSLWRFDGPRATVAFHFSEPSLEVGQNAVVGDEQNGLWLTTPDPPFGDTASPRDNQHLDVVRLDPDTGKPRVEAVLPPLDLVPAESGTAPGAAAFFADSYFLLQAGSSGADTDFTQLLRVSPLP